MYKYEMYPEQLDAFFHDSRLGLVEASTKAGKTHAAMRWLLDQARAIEPGQSVWWVAPVYAQAVMVRRRYQRALRAVSGVRLNRGENTLTLPRGSRIWFKSGQNPDHLYGEDVYAAVVDEASRVRRESIYAVRSTLTSTHGPWRMVGNVRGRSNYFYELCRQAERGVLGSAQYHKITAAMAARYNIPRAPHPGGN